MSSPTNPRNTKGPRQAPKPAAAGTSEPRPTLKGIRDVPGALVGMLRETKTGTDHVVDAISETSATYQAQIKNSLDGVRERLRDPGLEPQERHRLEMREGELLDRLHQAGRETITDVRGAHQGLLQVTALGIAGAAVVGAVALGNKDVAEGILKVATKVAPRAITT